jgi:hypothetical protein
MAFLSMICNQQLLNELPWLGTQISRPEEFECTEIVVDTESYAAVMPQRYSHADYPDRSLTCIVRDRRFGATQLVGRSDEEDRIEIEFEADTPDVDCRALAQVLAEAIQSFKNTPHMPLPVTWWKRHTEIQPQQPRSTNRLIDAVNQFCIALDVLEQNAKIEMMSLAVQTFVPVSHNPEELASLRLHVRQSGWEGFSEDSQKLLAEIFEKYKNP